MKLCWLLTSFNQMQLQFIDVPHLFLINSFLCVGFSQALVHWCCFYAARDESERCILL